MARCTNKEREYLDQLFQNNDGLEEIEKDVLYERIPNRLKSEYKTAFQSLLVAKALVDKLKSDFYSVCSDKRVAKIIEALESEARQ